MNPPGVRADGGHDLQSPDVTPIQFSAGYNNDPGDPDLVPIRRLEHSTRHGPLHRWDSGDKIAAREEQAFLAAAHHQCFTPPDPRHAMPTQDCSFAQPAGWSRQAARVRTCASLTTP